MGAAEAKQAILDNRTALGIEFGSTRIKAVLVDGNNAPIASGGHEWENRYENGVWTYSLEDIWSGLQDCYQQMAKDVEEKYGVELIEFQILAVIGQTNAGNDRMLYYNGNGRYLERPAKDEIYKILP